MRIMENVLFTLNATVPVYLIIALGFFLQRIGLFNESFNKTADKYVFFCALPISLYRSIATMDFSKDFDFTFCMFCFLGTTVMFAGVWAVSCFFLRSKERVGAFAQASARSSAAVLGIALATNIYGDAGMVPLMIMMSVPFFNVYSVLILSFSPQINETGKMVSPDWSLTAIKKACVNIVKNPLILGIVAGIPFALTQFEIPTMLDNALNSIAGTATPIALLMVGASFTGGKEQRRWKLAGWSAFVKLMLLPAVFLPIAAALGFRNSQMIAILIMTGAPTTVSCYVMAKNMHGDCALTANAVLLSTVLSAVSVPFWLSFMRTLEWI